MGGKACSLLTECANKGFIWLEKDQMEDEPPDSWGVAEKCIAMLRWPLMLILPLLPTPSAGQAILLWICILFVGAEEFCAFKTNELEIDASEDIRDIENIAGFVSRKVLHVFVALYSGVLLFVERVRDSCRQAATSAAVRFRGVMVAAVTRALALAVRLRNCTCTCVISLLTCIALALHVCTRRTSPKISPETADGAGAGSSEPAPEEVGSDPVLPVLPGSGSADSGATAAV